MRTILLFVGVLFSLGLAACSESMNSNNANRAVSNTNAANTNAANTSATRSAGLSGSDLTFAREAATGGMAEVELGRLAEQKAQNAEVKRYGQRMVMDHTNANEELKQLASRKGITLLADLTPEQKSEKDKLSKLAGANFDREYMELMVQDHDKDVKAFVDEATSAQDPDLKNFVTKTLPTLKEHQRMAKEIRGKLK